MKKKKIRENRKLPRGPERLLTEGSQSSLYRLKMKKKHEGREVGHRRPFRPRKGLWSKREEGRISSLLKDGKNPSSEDRWKIAGRQVETTGWWAENGTKICEWVANGVVRTVENGRRKISGWVENLWAAGSFPAFSLLRPGANYSRTLNCEFSSARELFGTICSYRVPVCGPINSFGRSLMCVNASELIFVWAEGCAFISM